MYGCNSMLESFVLFSGVKTFNFRSIHLVSFEGSVLLVGFCNK